MKVPFGRIVLWFVNDYCLLIWLLEEEQPDCAAFSNF
jgi:hypothetical protein